MLVPKFFAVVDFIVYLSYSPICVSETKTCFHYNKITHLFKVIQAFITP